MLLSEQLLWVLVIFVINKFINKYSYDNREITKRNQ